MGAGVFCALRGLGGEGGVLMGLFLGAWVSLKSQADSELNGWGIGGLKVRSERLWVEAATYSATWWGMVAWLGKTDAMV